MVKVRALLNIITYLCVLTAYGSVVQHLGIYYSAVFIALITLAAYLDYHRMIQLPRWLLNVLSLLVLVASAFRISSDTLIEPILDALVILIVIKLIEDKKFRDYMQVYAMCIFLLMGSSLISLSPVFLAYFLILATLSTVSLILLAYFSHNPEMAVSRENVTRILVHSLLICSISIPASAFFFLILPRTNYPLLSFLNKFMAHRSGFSDRVTLGDISDIQEDGNTIFRAEMEQVKENRLYWRGIVMDQFDGKSWKSSSRDRETTAGVPMEGQRVSQTIYLEPYGNKYLFALDRPESISMVRRRHMSSLTYALKEHINDRIRYKATSVVTDFQKEESIDPARYLDIPENFSPPMRELVNNLAENKTEHEKIKSLLRYLGGEEFKYSLKDLPVSQTPLEDFLLRYKHGNCEYFASSLAVMLRMAGIPSRLVGGYRGGYYNKTGGYYLVLQRNAHVWVEVYTRGHGGKEGWIRLDATPASADTPAGRYNESVFLQIKLLLDTFNYYWNKFVINYDFSKQMMILNEIRSSFKRADMKFDLKAVRFEGYVYFGLGLIFLASMGTAFVLLTKRGESHERLVSKFLRRMAFRGYEKRKNEGLEEFVARIDREDLRTRAGEFVNEFQRVFYKDNKFSRQQIELLENHIRSL
jgi:transglutaminase-like putative cysteine protease